MTLEERVLEIEKLLYEAARFNREAVEFSEEKLIESGKETLEMQQKLIVEIRDHLIIVRESSQALAGIARNVIMGGYYK